MGAPLDHVRHLSRRRGVGPVAPQSWARAIPRRWEVRIAWQKEIDASIASKADFEYLYEKPYEDRGIVRVAGPFTVESLAPHRTLGVDEHDELIDHLAETKTGYDGQQDFATMILEHLNTSGVQQAHREDRISFTALIPWPGDLICAEGRYVEGDADTGAERRAGIFVGPEFGTVSRPDLVAAAREAADADFDVLIACAFSYEAHATELSKLGRIPILKARMNADLHMAGDLKNTGKGNPFVIFGEPDIEIIPSQDNGTQARQIPGQGERSGRVPSQHRRNPQRRWVLSCPSSTCLTTYIEPQPPKRKIVTAASHCVAVTCGVYPPTTSIYTLIFDIMRSIISVNTEMSSRNCTQ